MSREAEIKDMLIQEAQSRMSGCTDDFYPLRRSPFWDDVSPYVAPFKELATLSSGKIVLRTVAVILEKSLPEEISPDYIASFIPAFRQMASLPAIPTNINARPAEQAMEALCEILKRSALRPKETIDKFCTLLPHKPSEYNGHSVAFEIEFFADKEESGIGAHQREIRPGPFVDGEFPLIKKELDTVHEISFNKDKPYMHTLHLNWGLTETQKSNVIKHEGIYSSILQKVAYLANSGERNIELRLKEYRKPSATEEFPRRLIVKDRKGDVDDCSGKGEQVARAEYKGFCLAEDADRALICRLVPAFWQALDDPNRARRFDKDLAAIFSAAKIGHLTMPSRLLKEKDDKNKEAVIQWEQDFGMIDRVDGRLKGRQVSYRPFVHEYLEAFAQGKEAEVLPDLLRRVKEQKRIYKQHQGDPALGKTFQEKVASRPGIFRFFP